MCFNMSFLKNLLSGDFGGHFFISHIVTQNFMTIFCPQNFPESAHANFQISIFSKTRGRNIFSGYDPIYNIETTKLQD